MYWLIPIMILGSMIRLVWLDKYPIGFTPDEAAFGYNAYSLLRTGHDEWGQPFWHLFTGNLESFGDFKLPLYAFLAVPAVGLLGLTQTAARVPNAMLAALLPVVIYCLARTWKFPSTAAILTAFLVAVSPWHISLSRGAFEANLITLFLPLSLALFFRRHYTFSIINLIICFYSYHSARLLSLLVLPFIIHKSYFINHKSILLILLFIPGLISLFGSGSARSADVSILSPTDRWQAVADRRFAAVSAGLPDILARAYSNKLVFTGQQLVRNYLQYFSPKFLFTDGAGETTYGMFPGSGVLYLIELISLIRFVYLIIKEKNKHFLPLLLLLLVSVLPAALAKGGGYAGNRAAAMIPFLALTSGLGWHYLKIPKYLVTALIIISFSFFLEIYLYHQRDLAAGMLFGRRELVERITALAPAYTQIQVSRSLSEPHIYFAFYNHLDPRDYQRQSVSWQVYREKGLKFLDQYDGYYLNHIRFGSLDYSSAPAGSLLAGRPEDFPDTVKPMFVIDNPDGTPAIYVAAK
jgi:hypothetical protein